MGPALVREGGEYGSMKKKEPGVLCPVAVFESENGVGCRVSGCRVVVPQGNL